MASAMSPGVVANIHTMNSKSYAMQPANGSPLLVVRYPVPPYKPANLKTVNRYSSGVPNTRAP